MKDEKETTIIALEIRLERLDKSPQLKEQLGRYAPKKGNTVIFRLCWQCYLDALLMGSPYWEGYKE